METLAYCSKHNPLYSLELVENHTAHNIVVFESPLGEKVEIAIIYSRFNPGNCPPGTLGLAYDTSTGYSKGPSIMSTRPESKVELIELTSPETIDKFLDSGKKITYVNSDEALVGIETILVKIAENLRCEGCESLSFNDYTIEGDDQIYQSLHFGPAIESLLRDIRELRGCSAQAAKKDSLATVNL